MDVVIKILGIIGTIVPVLLSTGLLVKYLPFLRNVSNKFIPLLNAVVAFLALFATPTAQAGIFDSIGHAVSMPAKLAAAAILSYWTSKFYDKYLDPLLPPGPQPIQKPKL